ncbi:MAG TPA: CvpA family protein [Stellaceae bacterium]|nr:CvpA family protein [Stellaceae bacterium]
MNALDICVVGIIILSGLFAFARGFVRECLSIAAWLAATAVALWTLPYLRPFAERFVPRGAIADAAASGAAFLVTLIVLSIAAGFVSRRVKRSSLSALDRTLGLVFGLMRGVIVVGVGFVALSFALPASGARPQWIAESRTAPLFVGAANEMARFVPDSIRQRIAQFAPQQRIQGQFENAIRAYSVPAPHTAPGGGSLTPEEQQRLNELFQRYGTTAPQGRAPQGQ